MTPKKKYTEQDLKNSIAWHRQWYANRPQVNNIDKHIVDSQLDKIENGDIPIEYGPVRDDMIGGYDRLWNKIYTTPETTARVLNHEINHAATGRSLITGLRDMITIRKNVIPLADYREEHENNMVRWKAGGYNDATSDYAYLANPSEVQTRLMRLRKAAGFKPEQVIDRKTLDGFMKKYKNGKDEEIDQLLDVVPNADNMIELLNKVSDNNTESQNAVTAEDGAVVNSKFQEYINNNKKLNFVDRIINWKTSPSLDIGDGKRATHKMSYTTDDENNAYVFPTVVYNKEKKSLEELPIDQAWNYAKTNKEYIKMPAVDAEEFSSTGYKKAAGWPKESYEPHEYAYGGIVNKTNVNAEGGEVVQLPTGQVAELQGPSHAQGGIDLQLPDGSVVFSDKLGIKDEDGKFKTLAERKAYREKEVARLEKLLAVRRDPLLKNSLARLQAVQKVEEEKDMMMQQAYNGNNGNANSSSVTADLGAVTGGLNAFGNVMGVIGTLQNTKTAAEWKANRAEMPNFYEDYGKRSLEKLNELNFNLDTQKAHALTAIDTKLQEQNQNTAAQIDAAGGTLNLKRALRASSKMSADRAYATALTGLESDYSSKLAENTREMSEMMMKQDEKKAIGASAQFTNEQQAYDSSYQNKMQNTSNLYSSTGGITKSISSGLVASEKMKLDQDYIDLIRGTKPKDDTIPNDFTIPNYSFNSSSLFNDESTMNFETGKFNTSLYKPTYPSYLSFR